MHICLHPDLYCFLSASKPPYYFYNVIIFTTDKHNRQISMKKYNKILKHCSTPLIGVQTNINQSSIT